TGLLSFPIPSREFISTSRVLDITREIDRLARESGTVMPVAVLAEWRPDNPGTSLIDSLTNAKREHERIKRRMIALQEELDWEVYRIYSLTEAGASEEIVIDQLVGIDANDRPFLWQENHAPASVPEPWKPVYETRRRLLRADHNLKLIETLVYKRP